MGEVRTKATMMCLLVREALEMALHSYSPATTKKHVRTAYEVLTLFVDDMETWSEQLSVDNRERAASPVEN
jgi:hypothetical protein